MTGYILNRLASAVLVVLLVTLISFSVMLLIPGAMDAGLTSVLFWASLAFALAVAAIAAFPVNRWLISRGKGHAVVHAHH